MNENVVNKVVLASVAVAGTALVAASIDFAITSRRINKSRNQLAKQIDATTEVMKQTTEKFVQHETDVTFEKIINENY